MLALAPVLALLAAAPGDLPIGFYGPLTGGSAALGQALRRGAVLAVEEVNAKGGVLGKKLALVERDDGAQPEKGAQAVKELVDGEKVVALLGPGNTGVANASTALCSERKVPQIVPSATGNAVNELFATTKDLYLFRLAASDALQSEMMVTEAYAARKKTKVALLHDASPYGEQGKARVLDLVAKRGAKLAYVGSFPVGVTDVGAQLTAAKAAGSEVILLYALGKEAAAVARSLEKMGWRAPIIGTWNLSNPAFVEGAGPFGEGAVTPQTFIEAGATEPAQQAFAAAYTKRWGTAHVEMGPAAAQAYDAVHLLALALKQAGTSDGPKVKAALEALKETYTGATGSYTEPWRPDDHEAVTNGTVVFGMVRAGQVVPDEPEAHR